MVGIATSAVLAPATAIAMEEYDQSLSALDALIERHVREMATDSTLWNLLPGNEGPMPRIQIGRTPKGRDNNGNDVFDPIWAYSREEVERSLRKLEDSYLGFGFLSEERRSKLARKHRDQHLQKLADFDAQVAEQKRFQDETGYTAALQAGKAQSAVVRAVEAEIIGFIPTTIAAAARKAAWVINAVQHEGCYASEDEMLFGLAETLAASHSELSL